MNKVSGKVLVKETGVGVANLLVVLCDVDPRTATQSTAYMDPSCLPDAGLERIGSVLTAESGDFELSFDASSFAAGDPERRPDLILRVYAPEDSQGLDQPTPLSPNRRLLLSSDIKRQNAGQSEAYILRLTQAQLGHFGIPYGNGQVATASPTRFADSILEAWKARDEIRERLRPRIREEAEKRQKTREKAKQLFSKLSALPATVRETSGFFVHRNDPPQKTREAQAAAIEAGMKRLRGHKSRIRLTERQMLEMKIEVDNGQIKAAYVDVSSARSIIFGNGDGGELVRARSLVDACHDRDKLAEAFVPPVKPESAGPESTLLPESAEVPDEEQLRQRILAQIRELEESGNGVASRPDALRLQAEIDALQLKGGPADAVALHDFNVLQIAFRHVWTEAFDGKLRSEAEDLYDEVARRADEQGLDGPETLAVNEVNDLRDFIGTIRRYSEMMKEIVCPPPAVGDECQPPPPPARGVGHQPHQPPAPTTAAIPQDRLERLILQLSSRLTEPYAFHIFAPNTYNFGILTTYRQRWEPLAYQAGDLVATIPLAPGETRKYTQRLAVKKSRSEREVEKSLSSHRDEATQTSRADAEIVHKASTATNFKMSASGSFSVGIASLSGASDFALNQANESSDVKKTFHEAVIRAANEYSKERSLEVTTSSSEDLETSTSGEISNPNNEITVTYLFYELQRRYRISEHLHKLTPVILVAQDVPAPHEIDEAWLLGYEWILRRVLLDDSFELAFDYLNEGFTGDELGLEIKKANWQKQNDLVIDLEASLKQHRGTRDALRAALVSATENQARAEAGESSIAQDIVGGLMTGGLSSLFGTEPDEAELLKAKRQAVEMTLGYTEETVKEIQDKLRGALETLQQATDALTKAYQNQSNKRTAIDQLRVHVKENILYYMQAIWAHEPPDQRFFRLYDQIEVEWIEPTQGPVFIPDQIMIPGGILIPGPGYMRRGVEVVFPEPQVPGTMRKLVEVADLDNLLGFKGNYLIFPLKESCYLTQYMMQEYVDDYFGARDPDPFGNYTTEELLDYIECAYHREDASQADRDALNDMLIERLTSPRRDAEEVVVPTGKLFIEALPGAHPLLEDFKLLHRAMDVKKVRAEVREAELENLRRAARLLAGEREDPDIEKKIVIQRDAEGVIVSPDA